MDKCPICKNYITSNRGIRGSQGVDENGDPVPFWTEDPLLTPLGLAGNNYKGRNPIRRIHIIELRRYYNEIESQLGLTPTSWVEELRVGTPVRKQHIVELRQVVERILDKLGLTIADYFKYDRLGNETGYTQTDWTDIDRSEGIPNIPKTTPVRAMHIEELRKGMYILTYWIESWKSSPIPDVNTLVLDKEEDLHFFVKDYRWKLDTVFRYSGDTRFILSNLQGSYIQCTTLNDIRAILETIGERRDSPSRHPYFTASTPIKKDSQVLYCDISLKDLYIFDEYFIKYVNDGEVPPDIIDNFEKRAYTSGPPGGGYITWPTYPGNINIYVYFKFRGVYNYSENAEGTFYILKAVVDTNQVLEDLSGKVPHIYDTFYTTPTTISIDLSSFLEPTLDPTRFYIDHIRFDFTTYHGDPLFYIYVPDGKDAYVYGRTYSRCDIDSIKLYYKNTGG